MLDLFVLSLEVHHTFCQVKPPSGYEFPSKFVWEKENKTCDSIGVIKITYLCEEFLKDQIHWDIIIEIVTSILFQCTMQHKIIVSQQSFIICKSIYDCRKALLNGHIDRLYLDTTATFISLNSFATFSRNVAKVIRNSVVISHNLTS